MIFVITRQLSKIKGGVSVEKKEQVKKKSIIWNLTRQCVWNCKFCCVSARYTGSMDKKNLEKSKVYRYEDELSYEEKIKIIDQLEYGAYRIDFSGGELLIDPLNIDLIEYASKKLGSENVGISISGRFVDDELIERLKGKISDVEITLDYIPYVPYSQRPIGYHEYAANAMINLKRNGYKVGAQTVLTNENIKPKMLYKMHEWLEKNDIDEWSLIRFFPSGRGDSFIELTPTYTEYCNAIDYIKKITKDSKVKVCYQYLLPNHDKYTRSCRAVKKSIGILPNGTVIGCFWALDKDMKPKDEKFVLGRLPYQNINDILKSSNAKQWIDNNSECIFFNKEMLEDNYNSERIIY